MAAISARLRDLLGRGRRVAALTGAGVSAESGVPTFRSPGGFWDNESLLDLATPQGFARDPRRGWGWYGGRRRQVSRCAPNAGPLGLASFGGSHPGFRLITQHVDRRQAAAGSSGGVLLPGELGP